MDRRYCCDTKEHAVTCGAYCLREIVEDARNRILYSTAGCLVAVVREELFR